METAKKSINQIKQPMNNDYLDVRNADGMPGLVDSTVALEFLMSIKTGIRNSAIALTEIADSEARYEIRNLLEESIDLHAKVTDLMIKKGWLNPYNFKEQVRVDMISSDTALKIANLELFSGDTSRLGTFATPNY